MATTNSESLSELERRAETSRAELAQTVDALHSRVSPDALKADMRSYARDTSQQMLETIEARVRENPLQAMAVAVGIAYPLWRIVARIPAPVLMIGAGLALSRRNGQDSSAGRYTGYSSYDGEASAGSGGQGMMASLKDKAAETTSILSEKASDAMESVRGLASDTRSRASEMLSERYQSGRQRALDATHQLEETYARTRDTMMDVIERHPLLVGGAAFAIGSLVASSLPVTRQENRMLGEASDEMKHRGQDLAAEGLEQAKTVAQQVYQTASDQVRQEGLTPDAAREAARAAVESARGAIEQTIGGGSGSSGATPRNPNS